MASPAQALREVAQATGVYIVAATGYYRDPYRDRDWFDRHSVDEIAELFVRDITEGIKGTDIRAGVIGEIGAHKWYTSAAEERSFRAAAEAAHKKTGLTVSTHATPWPTGLLRRGRPASSRHRALRQDQPAQYHDAVLARGAWVQFDTIRRANVYGSPDPTTGGPLGLDLRLSYICPLVEAGHLGRILLSPDIAKFEHLKSSGGTGYAYISTTFADLSSTRGLSDDQLRHLIVDNPRRMLTGDQRHDVAVRPARGVSMSHVTTALPGGREQVERHAAETVWGSSRGRSV